MTRLIIVLLGVAVFASCSCDDDEFGSDVSCIPQLDESSSPGFCTEYEEKDNDSSLCTYYNYGTKFLTENAKQYLKQYCMEDENLLKFASSTSEKVLVFKLEYKYHEFVGQGSNTSEICDGTEDQSPVTCIEYETAIISLTSDELFIDLTLQLLVSPITYEPSLLEIADILNLTYKNRLDTTYTDLYFLVDSRTSSYDLFYAQKVYPEIVLNGTQYNDVTTIDPDISDSTGEDEIIQYFLNKEYGLLGFTLQNGDVYTQLR